METPADYNGRMMAYEIALNHEFRRLFRGLCCMTHGVKAMKLYRDHVARVRGLSALDALENPRMFNGDIIETQAILDEISSINRRIEMGSSPCRADMSALIDGFSLMESALTAAIMMPLDNPGSVH